MSIAADILARALAWVRAPKLTSVKPTPIAPEVAPDTDAGIPASDASVLAVSVAAALCRRFEGLYLNPYLCPAGVPSIGYGATYYQDGRRVKLTDPAITRQQAEDLLLWMVRTVYLPAVVKLCPDVGDANRLAALIDFTFNLGAGNLRASTLRKRVNAGRWDAVPAELRKWRFGGGRELRGLVLRREAECALI